LPVLEDTLVPPSPMPPLEGAEPPPRKRRSWVEKFRAAFRGIKVGMRGHSSFSIHFFVTALVLMSAFVLECDRLEFCILIGCIGLVLTAELFNSAVETLFHGLPDETKEKNWRALDVAAGAVLLASLTASVLGMLIFVPRFMPHLQRLAEWLGIS
jgi:diacylglycerol kinase